MPPGMPPAGDSAPGEVASPSREAVSYAQNYEEGDVEGGSGAEGEAAPAADSSTAPPRAETQLAMYRI